MQGHSMDGHAAVQGGSMVTLFGGQSGVCLNQKCNPLDGGQVRQREIQTL